jgi:ABC-2 type transport system ATP-binding protein
MNAVVRTDALTKDFSVGFWRRRPRRALDGLSFEITRGEVFGLLGPNGAGKTTTLKLLMRLLWPTAGRMEIFGKPVGDPAARARIGFLPEQPIFYDHLSATELVGYFAGLSGVPARDTSARVEAVLDRVRIAAADRRRPLRQFSKGMLQRVGLAQALVHDPEFVILDEPMSGLDPLGRREIRELILALRDEGRTVLFSSHILTDAEALCSRVAILAGGRLVACGALADLTNTGADGWEIIAADVPPAAADAWRAELRRVTEIAPGRYRLEVASTMRPEPVIATLTEQGASLISVNPLRTTLEDVFVASVARTQPQPPPPPPLPPPRMAS